jgi:hypothetical protein
MKKMTNINSTTIKTNISEEERTLINNYKNSVSTVEYLENKTTEAAIKQGLLISLLGVVSVANAFSPTGMTQLGQIFGLSAVSGVFIAGAMYAENKKKISEEKSRKSNFEKEIKEKGFEITTDKSKSQTTIKKDNEVVESISHKKPNMLVSSFRVLSDIFVNSVKTVYSYFSKGKTQSQKASNTSTNNFSATTHNSIELKDITSSKPNKDKETSPNNSKKRLRDNELDNNPPKKKPKSAIEENSSNFRDKVQRKNYTTLER